MALAIVLGAANTYLGLYAGLTVSASIPAAVLSMFLLRKVMRQGTILENNIVQSMASAGESLAAGIIFTIPALVLSRSWHDFQFWPTTLVAFCGGMLGILFLIPFRRPFISERAGDSSLREDLNYPEGRACAEVLKSADTSSRAYSILSGMVSGILFKVATGLWMKTGAIFIFPVTGSGRRVSSLGIDFSVALAGVGYIVGLRIAALVFMGGVITWMIVLPLFGPVNPATDLESQIFSFWSSHGRFVGVGAMLVGTVESLLLASGALQSLAGSSTVQFLRGLAHRLSAIGRKDSEIAKDPTPETAFISKAPDNDARWSGLASSAKRTGESAKSKTESGKNPHRESQRSKEINTERDLPAPVVWLLIGVVSLAAIWLFSDVEVGSSLPLVAWVLILAFPVVAVAAYLVGLVGSSNSPVSGITLTVLLITGLLLIAFVEGSQGVILLLLVSGMICCAAATAGDIAQDLKTGSLIGAKPYLQQWAEILGVIVSAPIFALVLQLLHSVYGIGDGGQLKAPQATLFASLAGSMFSDLALPWAMITVGMAGGMALFIWNRQSLHRIPIMPLAVGMYLPLSISTPLLLGGLLHSMVKRLQKAPPGEPPGESAEPGPDPIEESAGYRGLSGIPLVRRLLDRRTFTLLFGDRLLYSSGLIAGEALAGIVLAGLFLIPGLRAFPILDEPIAFVLFLLVLLPLLPTITGRASNTSDEA
jgi:uncharacterized oligopeptide transporter (OPT) family protein